MIIHKTLVTLTAAIAISVSLMPTLPAHAARGENTCNTLVRNRRYRIISRSSGQPIYLDGRVVRYRYNYVVENRRGRRDRIGCVWNVRRETARLVNY